MLAVVVLTATLLQGHRAWARDHSFLVIYPLGWQQSFPAVATDGSTPLLRLAGPAGDEFQARVVVDHVPVAFAMPDDVDQLVPNLGGPVQCESTARPITVGGADALVTDCRTPDLSLEVILITRDIHRYVATLVAAQTQFDHRRTDFHSMLDSWAWQT